MTRLESWGFRGCNGDSVGSGESGIARIVSAHGDYYHIVCNEAEGELLARKKKSAFNSPEALKPMTGDFVRFRYNAQGESMITEVLPRKSWFERRDPTARRKAQTLAVNFDTLFIMMPLSEAVSRARLMRYLTLAGDIGEAEAVVVFTKADLASEDEARERIAQACEVAKTRVIAISSKTGGNLSEVRKYVAPGRTVAFIGASGVGKSSLLNALAGEDWMATQEVQEWSGRGRHTTTSRELVKLPCGAMVLDTPGIREIGMVGEIDDEQAKGEASHRWRRGSAVVTGGAVAHEQPWHIIALDTVDSTNSAALDAEPGDVVTAENQTSGRGRLDHKWIAAPGESLAMSAVVGVDGLLPTHVATLPLAAGLAVAEAIAEDVAASGASLALKWPNDVLVVTKSSAPRKLCGILCERNGDCVIVGIGVNVLQKEFPPEIASRAVSLAMLGVALRRDEVRDKILSSLSRIIDEWRSGALAALHSRIENVDFLRGREISVMRMDNDPLPATGLCEGIAPDGALLVDGVRIWSGEVMCKDL